MIFVCSTVSQKRKTTTTHTHTTTRQHFNAHTPKNTFAHGPRATLHTKQIQKTRTTKQQKTSIKVSVSQGIKVANGGMPVKVTAKPIPTHGTVQKIIQTTPQSRKPNTAPSTQRTTNTTKTTNTETTTTKARACRSLPRTHDVTSLRNNGLLQRQLFFCHHWSNSCARARLK